MAAIYEPDPVKAAKYDEFLSITTGTIPDAPFYVTAKDTFMSGWGLATDKVNKVLLPCVSFEEARIVRDNALGRSDMKNVRIIRTKPRYNEHVVLSVMSREDADRWYQPGSWTS